MIQEALISAMILAESAGNPRAIGDSGRAYGVLQIQKPVIEDVNRIYGTRFRHSDAFCPVKSRQICSMYLGYWCSPAKLGRIATMEDVARTWNGGPRGSEKPSTAKYWNKVSSRLALR